MTQPDYGAGYSAGAQIFLGIGNPYGAIAYSPGTRRWGFSHGFTDRASAETEARSRCGASDAAVFYGCATHLALAIATDGAYGVASHHKPAKAAQAALRSCAAHGPEPHVELLIHTSKGPI